MKKHSFPGVAQFLVFTISPGHAIYNRLFPGCGSMFYDFFAFFQFSFEKRKKKYNIGNTWISSISG